MVDADMELSRVFENISPLDHRYRAGNPDLWKEASEYLSESAFVRYQVAVEVALLRAYARRGLVTAAAADEFEAAARSLSPAEVYAEEEKTRHNIRALVNCLGAGLRPEIRAQVTPFIHLGATSMDILDTANALRYRDAAARLLMPLVIRLEEVLIRLAWRERATVQIARTHGQHAVPISFGFAVAEYVERVGERGENLRSAAANLRGKLTGAVGAYNALSLAVDDPEALEEEVLAELGLRPAPYSTQVVCPEYLTDFVHAMVSLFGVLANIADDLRHLQRTEISEVGEYFAAEQVGSSTMPHKRNPWNFEHVKSLWKEFVPRMMTVYFDQISEHQRDLTNSASSRFVPEVIFGLALALDRLARVLGRLAVDREALGRNLAMSGGLFVAEPLYIALALAGHPAAHEAVRRLTLEAEKHQEAKAMPTNLLELARRDEELAPYAARFTAEQKSILEEPERYVGLAVAKTEKLCRYWAGRFGVALDDVGDAEVEIDNTGAGKRKDEKA